MADRQERGEKEAGEECLEALYRLELEHLPQTIEALRGNSDLAGVDIGNVLLELMAAGFVTMGGEAVRFTRGGRIIGRRIYTRHELAEGIFSLLGMRKSRAHEEACRLEHEVGVDAESGLADEQRSLLELFSRGAIPLTRAQEDEEYRVCLISGGGGSRRRLEDMGIAPGTSIRLRTRRQGGPVEIEIQGSRLALGRGIASKVVVIPAAVYGRHEPSAKGAD